MLEEGKTFFQNGVSPLEAESDMTFELVNFKGDIINSIPGKSGEEVPFTVQGYFEHHKLSKVQLYIACRPQVDEEDTDEQALMTSPFSLSDKGRKWRQNLPPESESVKADSQSWASEDNRDTSPIGAMSYLKMRGS